MGGFNVFQNREVREFVGALQRLKTRIGDTRRRESLDRLIEELLLGSDVAEEQFYYFSSMARLYGKTLPEYIDGVAV